MKREGKQQFVFNPKKAVSVLGTVLMLVSVIFIARRILQTDIEFSFYVAEIPWLVLISAFIGSNTVISAFFFWWLVQRLTGCKLERRFSVLVYCISNLYKYLPGSVMYALGRNRLAVEVDGISHAKVFGATLIEGVFSVLAALAFAGLFASGQFYDAIRRVNVSIWIVTGVVIGGVVLTGAVLAFFFRKRLALALHTFVEGTGGFSIRIIFWVAARSFLVMFITGMGFVFVLALLGHPLALQQFTLLMGMYALSWMLGFMVPGAPGGLGVREAALLLVVGGTVEESLLVTAVIMHRVLSIGGDVLAYIFALVAVHTNRR